MAKPVGEAIIFEFDPVRSMHKPSHWDEQYVPVGRDLRLIQGGLSNSHSQGSPRGRTLKVLQRVGFLVVVVLAGIVVVGRLNAPSRAIGGGSIQYVVKPGDSLWSISESHSGGGDPRPLMFKLQQELGGATTVYAGERLSIPRHL